MIIPYPDWKPDLAQINGSFTQTAQNVLPRSDGYGPWKSHVNFSQALPAACRGYFVARNTDATVSIFAGTATKLYELNASTLAWTDVSLGAGSYTALPTSYHWQFAQFGNFVIAVQPNVAPQVFTLLSSSAFGNLAGSPPQAAYITVVNRFVILGGLTSNPFRVQWSDLGDSTNWSTNSSGSQDLPDGGLVRNVAGGEYGIIFQETVIRRMVFMPGDVRVFVLEKVTEDKGLIAPYSVVKAGNQVLFLAQQGFQAMGSTGVPAPVGKEKFDRYFFNAYDSSSLQLIMGADDPEGSRCYWAFKSKSGNTGLFDQIICYDYVLDKASLCVGVSGEFINSLSAPGTTLENLDAAASGLIAVTGVTSAAGLFRVHFSGGAQASWNYGIADTTHNAGDPGVTSLGDLSQNTVEIYGVTGTGGMPAAINQNWAFTSINASTIDLKGSTFTGAYTSGGTIGGALDSLTFSLDDIALSALPKLSVFDSLHIMHFFTGPAFEATIDSPEQELDSGRRVRVHGFRPLTDAVGCFGSIGGRENLQLPITYSAEQVVNDRGNVPANVSTRLARARLRIPAGTVWTAATGIEPDFTQDGLR